MSSRARCSSSVLPSRGTNPRTRELPEYLEYRPQPRSGPRFRILRTDRGGYRVVGKPPSTEELEEALRRTGIKPGAEVELEGETLEWQ